MRSEYGTAVILSIKNREDFSRTLYFHWFPVDQWVFEVFGRQIYVPRIEIPQNTVFPEKLDFHWFPVDQWGFEVNGSQIRVPQIELPLCASKVITVCLLDDNVLLTRLQTDKQTNRQTNLFYFVRPSFQSREYHIHCLLPLTLHEARFFLCLPLCLNSFNKNHTGLSEINRHFKEGVLLQLRAVLTLKAFFC